jgi:hypothetical protein
MHVPSTDGTAPDAEYIRLNGPGPLHVWRRSDGYVGWTRGTKPPAPYGTTTYDVLMVTYDEHAARARLDAERDAP